MALDEGGWTKTSRTGNRAPVSRIITFFTAPGHEAASAVVATGPAGIFGHVAWVNFDPEDAMIIWESVLTGRSCDELLGTDEPETVADPDEGQGPVVLTASPHSRKRSPIPAVPGSVEPAVTGSNSKQQKAP